MLETGDLKRWLWLNEVIRVGSNSRCWCPYKKRSWFWGAGRRGPPMSQGERPQKRQHYRHHGLRIPASRTVRLPLGHGGPRWTIQYVRRSCFWKFGKLCKAISSSFLPGSCWLQLGCPDGCLAPRVTSVEQQNRRNNVPVIHWGDQPSPGSVVSGPPDYKTEINLLLI